MAAPVASQSVHLWINNVAVASLYKCFFYGIVLYDNCEFKWLANYKPGGTLLNKKLTYKSATQQAIDISKTVGYIKNIYAVLLIYNLPGSYSNSSVTSSPIFLH